MFPFLIQQPRRSLFRSSTKRFRPKSPLKNPFHRRLTASKSNWTVPTSSWPNKMTRKKFKFPSTSITPSIQMNLSKSSPMNKWLPTWKVHRTLKSISFGVVKHCRSHARLWREHPKRENTVSADIRTVPHNLSLKQKKSSVLRNIHAVETRRRTFFSESEVTLTWFCENSLLNLSKFLQMMFSVSMKWLCSKANGKSKIMPLPVNC